eukprot:343884-Chlamydomonas_euryale.AAC.1
MALLAARLSTPDARAALATGYAALGRMLPEAAAPAAVLASLVSTSAKDLGEPDYEARLGAYAGLTAAVWGGMSAAQALPLLLAAAFDLRNGDDLALRQAAAQAVARLVDAAAVEARGGSGSGGAAPDPGGRGTGGNMLGTGGGGGSASSGGDGLLHLMQRHLYPQLRSQLSSASLAVRQESLRLLRHAALELPQHVRRGKGRG